MANCGLRLDDEAVRVAVGMRLGLALCVSHSCPCGGQVDAQGLHAMVCKKAPGRIARHQVLDDVIWRSLGSAGEICPPETFRSESLFRGTGIPATIKPSGLVRQVGKRPDGLIVIPWQGGKSLVGMSLLSARWHIRMLTGQLLVWEWWQSWQPNQS